MVEAETKVLIPSPRTLANMDNLMAPLLESYTANEIESKKLKMIRDSLLPKLMSGKIRVPT